MTTVESGSKGDHLKYCSNNKSFRTTNYRRAKSKPLLSNGRRTLPHYILKEENNDTEHFHDLLEEYESQGFISSSFAQGLNPKEFFFHCMAGRQGVCDTAMSTRTNKWLYYEEKCQLTEDIKVHMMEQYKIQGVEDFKWLMVN